MTAWRHSRQGGFSLIELMVAMLIGLFLVGGLVYTYVGSKRSYSFNEAMSRIQENGRFAIHFLARDTRQAGYMSCARHAGTTRDVLNASSAYALEYDKALEGYNNLGVKWPDRLDPVISGQPIHGSDAITIRWAQAIPAAPTTDVSGTSESFSVSTPNSLELEDILGSGDILMITNCIDAAIFQVTSDDDDLSAGTVEHQTGTGLPPGNSTSNLGTNFEEDSSQLLAMRSVTYYLGYTDNAQVPLLLREVNGVREKLVPGVENMQILYGEDTGGDHTADQYVDADDVGNMANVVSVRIALLLTSLHEVTDNPVSYVFNGNAAVTPTDRYLRREFTTTINLRNRTP